MLKKILEFFKKPKNESKPSEKETQEEKKTESLSEVPRATKPIRPLYRGKKPQIDPRIKFTFNYFKAFPVGKLDKPKTVTEHVREMQEAAEAQYRNMCEQIGIPPGLLAAAKNVNVDGRRITLNVEFVFEQATDGSIKAVLTEDSKKRIPVFENLLTCFLN